MSHYNGCGCGGHKHNSCNSCTSHNEIQQAVNDALAFEKENLEQYENNAAQSAADAAKEAAKAVESASAAAQSQTNAETAAGTATQAASSVTNTAVVLEETAERLEQAQDLLEEQISALQTKPVYFEVSTPTNTLVLTETETVFNVRSIYVASARQDVGYGFTFDKVTRTITLAEGITADAIAEAEEGFILVTAICDVYSSDDPTSFPLILASNAGANNVGTLAGITVEEALSNNTVNTREQWKRHIADAGLNLVDGSFEEGATVNTSKDVVWHVAGGQCYLWGGELPKVIPEGSTPDSTGGISEFAWKLTSTTRIVDSYANLKTVTPKFAGEIITLSSFNSGANFGFGFYEAVKGSAVEDGGINCIVNSNWFWRRVLPDNRVDVTMFGCDPTGSTECHEQLMNALNYSATHRVLLTQSGVTLVGQSVIAPTGIIIDFSGYVVMTDATNLETTYGGYAWVQGAYRGTTTDAYTNIKNLKLSTSLDDLMRGAPRTSPFDGKGLCVMEYITHGYIYTAGFQYGGVYIAKEKGAMRGDMVECYVRARPSNDDKYSKAYGFYNAGADTKIDKLKCIKYARGAWTGDFSYFGTIHCWGLPALISTDPNADGYRWGTMLAGLFMGTSSYVGYYYCDTPETTGYDVAAVFDDTNDIYMGYGTIFVGYESMISNYMFLLYKDAQKVKKCRIAHYKDGRNQHKIGYLTCHDGAIFDDTNAITYANKKQDFFQNYIDNLSGAYLHQYIDTWSTDAATHVVFNGVTSHSGTVKYVRRGQSLDVYLNVVFSAVDTSATSFNMKFVNIPTHVLTQSSTMPVHNITTWGGVSRPPAAVDTLNVMNGASQVGTVSVPRNLSGLSISSVTNGLITFKFVDIANGTAWNVSPSQLRVGGLIMSLSMCI
ncbi:hypothetical protein vBKpPHS106_62 [Klebsiella phage VB_KpP_HS106]|nr:hypothetical protein vBKpPHS106_62 [Klebsiella phage VB_KpP_HS106]